MLANKCCKMDYYFKARPFNHQTNIPYQQQAADAVLEADALIDDITAAAEREQSMGDISTANSGRSGKSVAEKMAAYAAQIAAQVRNRKTHSFTHRSKDRTLFE